VVLHRGPNSNTCICCPSSIAARNPCQLIDYAQRGRGASSGNPPAEHVTLASEIEDLDALRAHLGLPAMMVLGHSWGGVLVMECAILHPERTSHLILLDTSSPSHDDHLFLRAERRWIAPRDMEELVAVFATPEYRAGELEADAAYYRVHLRPTSGRLQTRSLEHA
jgi:proline iminopeptidase